MPKSGTSTLAGSGGWTAFRLLLAVRLPVGHQSTLVWAGPWGWLVDGGAGNHWNRLLGSVVLPETARFYTGRPARLSNGRQQATLASSRIKRGGRSGGNKASGSANANLW